MATFKPTRLPCGPQVGPAEFQRRAGTVWIKNGGEGRRFMDDLSWSASGAARDRARALGKEKLLRNLEICTKNGITLEARKAQLFRSEAVFSGVRFGKQGKMIEPAKEIKLGERATKNEKGIAGFLAFINYLREFDGPRVLTRCGETFRAYVKKGGKPFSEFGNDREAQECVRELREGVGHQQLKPFGGTGNLIVMTDASDYGVGGVAFEPPAGGDRKVGGRQIVGAYSRSFSDTEARWSVFEKEINAIIQACAHYPVL